MTRCIDCQAPICRPEHGPRPKRCNLCSKKRKRGPVKPYDYQKVDEHKSTLSREARATLTDHAGPCVPVEASCLPPWLELRLEALEPSIWEGDLDGPYSYVNVWGQA